MIEGCAKVVKAEQDCEEGLPLYWITPGLGEDWPKGFPHAQCPATLPDLSEHHSIMADVLKHDAGIYEALKGRLTENGVTLAQCIKTGMDNRGHAMIRTVGMVAGDEESYETFRELFDPVIALRHGGYSAGSAHETDLDVSKLSKARVDPSGKYVVSTRVRTQRGIRGRCLPPSCTKQERREVERTLTKALLELEDELKGSYFPLAGSYSYVPKPGGMTAEQQSALEAEHLLFHEPDSTLLLASGVGRHWPDGRGVFANAAKTLAVWVNEQDHARIVATEAGADVRAAFERLFAAATSLHDAVQTDGAEFMHSDRLGFLSVCPSNLGTGLHARVTMKVPLLSARADFKDLCAGLRLQA